MQIPPGGSKGTTFQGGMARLAGDTRARFLAAERRLIDALRT